MGNVCTKEASAEERDNIGFASSTEFVSRCKVNITYPGQVSPKMAHLTSKNS